MTTYHITTITDLGGKRTHHPDPGRQAATQRRYIVQISDGRTVEMTRNQLVDLHKRGKAITCDAEIARYVPTRISGIEAGDRA